MGICSTWLYIHNEFFHWYVASEGKVIQGKTYPSMDFLDLIHGKHNDNIIGYNNTYPIDILAAQIEPLSVVIL